MQKFLWYNGKDFLKLEDIKNFKNVYYSNGQRDFITSVSDCNSTNVLNAVKTKLAKTFLSKEDGQQFVENNCFFDETLFRTNCSNYTDLEARVDLRVTDYYYSIVSI